MDFKACDKKKKQAIYATIVIAVGNNFEKPSDAYIKLEPTTSSTIDNDKNKYFIVLLF